MIDYESPITQIVSDMQMGYENGVLKAVQNVGFHVNKEELTKALSYDRGQYQKGYVDGLNADKWIPCSEKLPKETGDYLVSSKGTIWVANWFNYTWWGIEKRCRWTDIEAWQPLPSPFKKGE